LDYLRELQNHVKTFTQGKKSRKSEKLQKMNNEEFSKDKESKIKKVFPDSLEKTETLIQNLQKKIEKLEYTIRNKVYFY